jgi:hypothetical protein
VVNPLWPAPITTPSYVVIVSLPGRRSDAALLPNCITAHVGNNGGQRPPIDFPIEQVQPFIRGLHTFRPSKKAAHSAKKSGSEI